MFGFSRCNRLIPHLLLYIEISAMADSEVYIGVLQPFWPESLKF